MTPTRWTRSFSRFASVALAAAGLAAVAVHGEHARACGWGGPYVADVTLFDPAVLGPDTSAGLYYDPSDATYGGDSQEYGTCAACTGRSLAADWQAYLQDTGASPADITALVDAATAHDRDAIAKRITARTPAAQAKVTAAVAYLALAHETAQYAALEAVTSWDDDANAAAKQKLVAAPARLVAAVKAAAKGATEPFLVQRYAFLELRVRFYRKDFAGVIKLADASLALAAPSPEVKWRAKWYLAGALARAGKRARASLELARIGASYGPLGAEASTDFRPIEDSDWKESLRLAKDPKDKAALWRMVGIRHDGIVAIREIRKLDPGSPLLALLVAREVARLEANPGLAVYDADAQKAAAVAAKKEQAELETIVTAMVSTPSVDRPWFYDLVAGHLAALRGDFARAKPHLEHAMALRPRDARVQNQGRASLALAYASTWKSTPQAETSIATALTGVTADFGRRENLDRTVRGILAAAYLKAGKRVDAEFLMPEPLDPYETSPRTAAERPWTADFLRQMIARSQAPATAWDRMILDRSYTTAHLEMELALRYVLDNDFAAAAKVFADPKAERDQLHVDPFVIHVVDCHDCDQEKYAASPWTHASMVAHLADLATKAAGKGEPAALAALELGNGLYNLTYSGNARVVLAGTHLATTDTRLAAKYYKRAFDLSSNRETKAQAAWLAAKCEVASKFDPKPDEESSATQGAIAATVWYPVVKRFAATKYAKEVLKECGWYATWTGSH